MNTKSNHTIRLGIFVLAGLLFLILLLYMIGRNQNLFGKTFILKAHFQNVQGLVVGNNVRYAGIEAGTVKRISILNDSLVEVSMIVEKDMQPFIRNNSVAYIGSDGLMGNKVINISPSRSAAPLVKENDVLPIREMVDMDDMLRTLNNTNNDIALIAGNLVTTTARINNSDALWSLLNDKSLPQNIRASAANIKTATAHTTEMVNDLQAFITDAKNGKGLLGIVLKDTQFARNLTETAAKLKQVANRTDELAATIDATVNDLHGDFNTGKGTVNALLKDSAMVIKLNASLDNIQKGTDAFSQNMEALKHNFLFRRYFKKLEKQKQRNSKQQVVIQ